MSSTFSHLLVDQHPSYLRLTLSPSTGCADDRSLSQNPHLSSDPRPSAVPVLLYPTGMEPAGLGLYKSALRSSGPSPSLLPYLGPFHHQGHFRIYECPFEPAFIQKRNERERQRVKCVNQGYAKLRDHLPGQSTDKRLSKVETLRAAIRYIKYLERLVELEEGHRGAEAHNTSSSSTKDP